jgi:tRNA (cytidine/uridine-2'-O-)-methyltransferase
VRNLEICLFEPEIAQNTGTIARLCACFGVSLNIIEPMSFFLEDKNFKRAGMDYIEKTNIKRHDSFKEFRNQHNGRIILLDTKATTKYYDLQYNSTDCILAGKESVGVPKEIYDLCDEKVLIPMIPEARSLNVAISVGVCLSEAMRQLNYIS